MASKKLRGIVFSATSGDHEPPHVHAFANQKRKKVVITLVRDGTVELRESARGVTRAELVKALEVATEFFDDLMTLWEKAHAEN